MGSLSIWHWIIVLLVIVLVFGTRKLRSVGEDLGGAVRGFRKGLQEGQLEQTADHKIPERPVENLDPSDRTSQHK